MMQLTATPLEDVITAEDAVRYLPLASKTVKLMFGGWNGEYRSGIYADIFQGQSLKSIPKHSFDRWRTSLIDWDMIRRRYFPELPPFPPPRPKSIGLQGASVAGYEQPRFCYARTNVECLYSTPATDLLPIGDRQAATTLREIWFALRYLFDGRSLFTFVFGDMPLSHWATCQEALLSEPFMNGLAVAWDRIEMWIQYYQLPRGPRGSVRMAIGKRFAEKWVEKMKNESMRSCRLGGPGTRYQQVYNARISMKYIRSGLEWNPWREKSEMMQSLEIDEDRFSDLRKMDESPFFSKTVAHGHASVPVYKLEGRFANMENPENFFKPEPIEKRDPIKLDRVDDSVDLHGCPQLKAEILEDRDDIIRATSECVDFDDLSIESQNRISDLALTMDETYLILTGFSLRYILDRNC